MKIKQIIFDLGGVIITLDQPEAVRRFAALGLQNAQEHLDAYTQQGIFGALERGDIDAETFRLKLSELVKRNCTHEECAHGWLGYAREVPQRNLHLLQQLRTEGYGLFLLSNTNPYMMRWVNSSDFDGKGHAVSHYFDKLFLSYELKMLKPNKALFQHVLRSERLKADETLYVDDGPDNVAAAAALGMHTFCPVNGTDWTGEFRAVLNSLNRKAL